MMKPNRAFAHLATRATGALVLVAALVPAGVVHAQPGQAGPARPASSFYANPWGPSPPSPVMPIGGTVISFRSPQEGAADVILTGVLFKPAETPKGAVVIVAAGGGISNNREGHYARALSSAGYLALAIDGFGPRGVADTTANN